MTKSERISYAFIFGIIVTVAWLGLATPLITVMFSYFALSKLHFGKMPRWISAVLFLALLASIFYGFIFFVRQAFIAFPDIVSRAVPSILKFAEANDIHLPFEDAESLKALAVEGVMAQVRYLGNFAKIATKESAFLIIGVVVAISIFLNPKMDLAVHPYRNVYTLGCEEIAARFRGFYRAFATVMGAQILISAVNTALTAIFLLWISLPYTGFVVGVTFLCGLLPIVGNIISNSVIVGVAFTVSPTLAVIALVYLVVIHKLEYFLNSKIIGDRIKNPMWLTLLGLIIAERLMGIPGMILAPVILFYLKLETSKIPAKELPEPQIVESE